MKSALQRHPIAGETLDQAATGHASSPRQARELLGNGSRNMRRLAALLSIFLATIAPAIAQVATTQGFLNLPRAEAPGTLLSHPVANGSEPIGRTTSINYLNGWVIVGGEAPGSRPGSDLVLRVYDISNPANPVRRYPSDFGLTYQNNWWIQGNYGWNAHGTAQYGSLLLPGVLRVANFGAPVELGGTNGIPRLGQLPLWYNRSSQAGPWEATQLWYAIQDLDIAISKISLDANGNANRRVLASIDHVGAFGGGDWHPMFFGDLLIMARSGTAANDGVVIYRLQYNNFDDADPANDSITPHFVGSLPAGFQGYWPNLFSDGTGLYVIGSTTNILIGADITGAVDPAGDGSMTVANSLTVSAFTNASYPVYQDQFGFIHNRKIDMTRFLAGDANPIVLTLNEVATGVNTSQMSLPLGNLWLTGGYPIAGFNQGMGVWVHQQAADTTPPRVTYHIPQANRTNYPRHAPLSFLVHEHPRHGGPRNGIDFTLRPVLANETLGAAVPGFLIHDFSGNMTFTPNSGLAADTTYQVDFLADPANQIGFCDAAGNYIEPYSYRFSTGGGINATTPPTFTAVTANEYQPAPGGEVTITATATGTGPLTYRFNFDGTWTDWSSSATASHTYASAGRPRVLVQVRDANGNVVMESLRLLVIAPPPAGSQPTQSSTMAIGDDPLGRRLWSVNPDANTVSVLDAATGAKVAEHVVGENPRNIARDANGRYWVTCHRSDEIRVLNPDGSTHTNIVLAYGAAPFGIAPSPDGQQLFVTLYGSGFLHRYSAANPNAAPVVRNTLFPTPRAIAISANGQRVLVTRFLSPELEAEIYEFAGTSAALDPVRILRLSSANPPDGGDRGSGVPNYLSGIAISPNGQRAAVVSKQDNVLRGTFFGAGNLTHETTVRSVVSFLDLSTHAEIRHTRRDFDNSDSPSALTYTPLGDTLLVALQGNNTVVGMDTIGITPVSADNTAGATLTSPAVITFDVSTGLAPQGVLIDAASGRLFSQDFMGRSVTVRNAAPLLVENRTSLPLLTTTSTVSTELLSPPVLQGKQIFYNAADLRMTAEGYISCATCHVDGGHDGRVWDFTGRGEGLRRTTDLRGRSGLGHGNVHWSGNFDEIQDFEHDIRGGFGGTGFLSLNPQEFAAQHPSPASGKTGLSPELDALAAYVASLTPEHTPRSPARSTNGALTAAAVRGRDIFVAQNCASCHSGNALTGSALTSVALPSLSNVGTQSLISGGRLGQALAGIDTPTLHGLHATRTFLHQGQAQTLESVFTYAGGTLHLAGAAQVVATNPSAVGVFSEDPTEGGGGFARGMFGGTAASLTNEAGAGLRFVNVNGGAAGGPARLAIRYVKQYNNSTATLRVNGASQPLDVFRQYPDNSWQISGWRWAVVETTLQPGATNTIEILRGTGDFTFNALLVSNAETLAAAQPHRVVQSLSTGDRNDLLEYLRQLDGRDAAGVPLVPPTPPAPQSPAIVGLSPSITLAEGNLLSLTVAVSGTGPFSYQWYRGATPVGTNSATFSIPAVQATDAGAYSVAITNAQGNTTSEPVVVTINPALAIVTESLPLATVGVPYSTAATAFGGVSTRSWSLAAGVIPPGLTLFTNGEITGTPAVPARAEVTLRVTDSSGTITRTLLLEVAPVGGFVNDPDLVLHYTFDEGSGTRVWDSATGGNNHVTTVGNAQWVANGRFGGAYGPANATSEVAAFFPANQADLDFDPRGDEFTISMWVRTNATSGYNTALGKDSHNSPTTQFRLWVPNSATIIEGINGSQYSGGLTVPVAINDGQWHLLTLVNYFDGAGWRSRIYYDNGTTFRQFNTGAGGRVSNLLRVGDTSRGGNPWRGQIDDLRIYRRALSPAEIATLYTTPDSETFTDWLSANLTPAQQANPAFTNPGGDANGNGVPNLIEFAIGNAELSPLRVDVTHAPWDWTTLLTLTRNANARGVTIIIESTTDFTTWTPLATSINGTPFISAEAIDENPGMVRDVSMALPMPATPTFYRLRVLHQ